MASAGHEERDITKILSREEVTIARKRKTPMAKCHGIFPPRQLAHLFNVYYVCLLYALLAHNLMMVLFTGTLG